ncbi:MAG: flavodoxin family protein [Candidatus Thorarchaeota archaeon]
MEKLKILAIGGSPKKGNTYSVLNEIKDSFPDIDFNLLMLKDVNLEQCKGCYTCVRIGEEKCPLKDDRDMILDEILKADGVIFASPVYVNSATSLMKNFIERLGYIGHRPRFYDKFAMVIAVCGMFGAKETNKFMDDIFTSFGFSVVSSLELQVATKSEKEKIYNHEKIIEAFDKFITRIEKGEINTPTLGQVTRFYLFKSLSNLIPDYFKADHEYYKDKPKFPFDIDASLRKEAKWSAKKTINEFVAVHV